MTLRLFFLGMLSLFLELLLIRFLAGAVWNLGYFPNLVLIAAFVGLGTGFAAHRRVSERLGSILVRALPVALALLVAMVYTLAPAVPGFETHGTTISGELYFTSTPKGAGEGSPWIFVACFALVYALFAVLGQHMARPFSALPPLVAYSADIAGSCCGILAFLAISAFHVPPVVWFAAVGPLLVAGGVYATAGGKALAIAATVALGVAVHLHDGANPEVEIQTWSPYQRVELVRRHGLAIHANGIYHQILWQPHELARTFYREIHADRARRGLAPARSVLIIGAGSGNDVAAALAWGDPNVWVDAVEIDPAIAEIGRRAHPAKPYDDPRVHLVIDDGRAVLVAKGERRYDLIIFALTDSVVKASPMAQLRLENYLFTVESITRASELLAPEGELVLYNYYRTDWLVDKLARLMTAGVGAVPREVYKEKDFVVLAAARPAEGVARAKLSADGPELPVDDWPFLYLRERGLPALYGGAMGVAVLLVGVLLFALRGGADEGEPPGARAALELAFALMGLAFLLLETKSVIQFSLLFGTTWINSSLVFLGVLLSVLFANGVAALVRGRWLLGVAFALLLASCVLGLAVPLGALLAIESRLARFAVASALVFAPVFFANLIFSAAFRERKLAARYFGWNLIGATLGGVLEYTSMAIGYRALMVVVLACYAATGALLALHARLARTRA